MTNPSESSLGNKAYMARLDKNMSIFYNKWQHLLPMVRGLELPEIVVHRMNNLSIQAYDATRIVALKRICSVNLSYVQTILI